MDGHLIEIDEESLRQAEGRTAFERLVADLNHGFYARALVSEEAVRREKAYLESVPLVTNEGNLQPKAVVAPESFHFWGQRLGYECWNDQTFLREYLRDNEASRVNARMGRPSLLVSGFKAPPVSGLMSQVSSQGQCGRTE